MRLLTLCDPIYAETREPRFNGKATSVVLSTDEIHRLLALRGWEIDVVSLTPGIKQPLFRSGLPLKRWSDVAGRRYDLVWHMFPDPTPVYDVDQLHSGKYDVRGTRVVNHALRLARHTKHRYLPILEELGIGVKVLDGQPDRANWNRSQGIWLRNDGRAIAARAFHVDRRVCPTGESERIITQYIDNARDGLRSFVRFAYAFGRGFTGFRYYFSSDLRFAKTGQARTIEPYVVPQSCRASIRRAMQTLGCDTAHLEGIPTSGGIRIFDVNPNPMSAGRTLTPISEKIVQIVAQTVERLVPHP